MRSRLCAKSEISHILEAIEQIERDIFCSWLRDRTQEVEFIFHIGARTDTQEQDRDLLHQLNTAYTQELSASVRQRRFLSYMPPQLLRMAMAL